MATKGSRLGRFVGRRAGAAVRDDGFSAESSRRSAEDFERRTAGFADANGRTRAGPQITDGLGKWLKQELKLDGNIGRPKREPAHAVGWGDQKTMQPELWTVAVASPGGSVSAEYWVGNGFVSVKRTENSFLATMSNLHKGVGLSVGWVLLIDTLAGSIILLSLTGVLLWTELNKRKTVGAVIVTASIVAMVWMGLT